MLGRTGTERRDRTARSRRGARACGLLCGSPRAWARRQAHKLLVVRTAILVSTMFADCSSTDARPSGHATPGASPGRRALDKQSFTAASCRCESRHVLDPCVRDSAADEQQRRCGTRGDCCICPAERKTARRHDLDRVAHRGRAAALPEAARCVQGPGPGAVRKRSRMTRSAPAVREAAADDGRRAAPFVQEQLVRSAVTGPTLATEGSVSADRR